MRLTSILFVVPVLLVVACSGSEATPRSGTGADTKDDTSATDPGGDDGTPAKSSSGAPAKPPPPPAPPADVDAGHDPDPPSTKGADLGQACKADADCKSNVCFQGGSSSYCSLKCTTANAATVCVPPTFNGQCNKQGFCRKP
jgi:hypothetical protein